MTNIRVLLADDHAILREGLVMLVNSQPGIEVVAQASTTEEAVQLAQSAHPDVAVLDVSMPGGGGVAATEAIRASCPDVRVLVLTRHSDRAYVQRLMQAGANGYVLKKSAAETLLHAIRVVAEGGTYVEPSLAANEDTERRRRRSSSQANELTPREEEVLREVAWGRSSKEIAGLLSISTKTVESYKATAVEKLKLRSRNDIVRYAIARGWLSDEVAPD